MNLSEQGMLDAWCRRLETALHSHYQAANYFHMLHNIFSYGMATASLVILVSSIIPGTSALGGGALIPILAAAIAGVSLAQSGTNRAERAEQHRVTAAKYAAVRRELEEFDIFRNVMTKEDMLEKLSEIRHHIDVLGKEAPSVPRIIYKLAKRRLRKDREKV